MKRKTFYTLLVIVLTLSFFVTPVGTWGKIWLMQLFAHQPEIVNVDQREQLPNYNWRLKDADHAYLNFDKSTGKVVFIQFWASWHLPSIAELSDIQVLYNNYHDQVDFYIVTNEEQRPVEEFMEESNYTFPITYRIENEPAPFLIPKPSGTYIIDKKGRIVINSTATADWNNAKINQLLDALLKQ